jgi:hypothetical protein
LPEEAEKNQRKPQLGLLVPQLKFKFIPQGSLVRVFRVFQKVLVYLCPKIISTMYTHEKPRSLKHRVAQSSDWMWAG